MKLIKALVIHGEGADKIYIYTDLPTSFLTSVTADPLTICFDATHGNGVAYVKKNFPDIPVELIETRRIKSR